MSRRKIALVLAAVIGAVTIQSSSPALASRANGVCGGVEEPPGSENC